MTAQYSNKIYTITKVNKNSIMLDNNINIKKSNVLLITDDTEEITPEVHQKAVKAFNISKNKTVRSKVDVNNIIHTVREKRTPTRYL
jgi:hypothetical protein